MRTNAPTRIPLVRDGLDSNGPIHVLRIPPRLARTADASPNDVGRVALPVLLESTPGDTASRVEGSRVLLDWGADITTAHDGTATGRLGGLVVLSHPWARDRANHAAPPLLTVATLTPHGLKPLSAVGAKVALDLTLTSTPEDAADLQATRRVVHSRLETAHAAVRAGEEQDLLRADARDELALTTALRTHYHDGAFVPAWREAIRGPEPTLSDVLQPPATVHLDRPSLATLATQEIADPDVCDPVDDAMSQMLGADITPLAAVWLRTTEGADGKIRADHELTLPHATGGNIVTKSPLRYVDPKEPTRTWSKFNVYAQDRDVRLLIGQTPSTSSTRPGRQASGGGTLLVRSAANGEPVIPSQIIAAALMDTYPLTHTTAAARDALTRTRARMDDQLASPSRVDVEMLASLETRRQRLVEARRAFEADRAARREAARARAEHHPLSAAAAAVAASAQPLPLGTDARPDLDAVDSAMRGPTGGVDPSVKAPTPGPRARATT